MLRDQEGIHSIKVALLAERGVIEYDPKSWNPDKLMNVSLLSFILISRPLCTSLGSRSRYLKTVSIVLDFPPIAHDRSDRETRDVLAKRGYSQANCLNKPLSSHVLVHMPILHHSC